MVDLLQPPQVQPFNHSVWGATAEDDLQEQIYSYIGSHLYPVGSISTGLLPDKTSYCSYSTIVGVTCILDLKNILSVLPGHQRLRAYI